MWHYEVDGEDRQPQLNLVEKTAKTHGSLVNTTNFHTKSEQKTTEIQDLKNRII